MKFPIHITKRHVEGAGLHNEYHESVEPCDDYVDLDISLNQVKHDLSKILYNEYILPVLPSKNNYELEDEKWQIHIMLVLEKLDVWDKVIDMYYDKLREKYEKDFNHES